MDQISVDALRALVEQLPKTNLRNGVDAGTGQRYRFMAPDRHRLHWQWSWNSCFHAVVMAHVQPDLAVSELQAVLSSQDQDGFISHINFRGGGLTRNIFKRVINPYAWRQHHTRLIHPPVLAQAVERVTEVIGDAWFPVELMPSLDRYHRWLVDNRVPDPDGLLVIVSPYESGADQSPAFDAALGFNKLPGDWNLRVSNVWLDFKNALANYDSSKLVNGGKFRVKDALVNALYADSLLTMARLHRRYGELSVSNTYSSMADVVLQSILSKLWDRSRGAFFSIYSGDEQRSKPLTIGSLMPLIIPSLPEEQVKALVHHLTEEKEFSLANPVPSVAATDEGFSAGKVQFVGRGLTQVHYNWLLWRGLRRHEMYSEADRLAKLTIEMVVGGGLREFYSPFSGKGSGARNFACSGLVIDMALG